MEEDQPRLRKRRHDLEGALKSIEHVRRAANRILHPDGDVSLATGQAWKAISDTFTFVEQLFAQEWVLPLVLAERRSGPRTPDGQ